MRIWILPYLSISLFFVVAGCYHTHVMEHKFKKNLSGRYTEARLRFLEAARNSSARIESFRNPHTGPQGEALYTDVSIVGSNSAQDVLVISSGTHGVEGFAGSDFQSSLLEQGILARLTPNVAIVMIHAINPYGFAHIRRTNEDNIDLNRHFADFSGPLPKNNGYAKLAEVLAPKSLSVWENAKYQFQLAWYLLQYGKAELKKAVSGGQYEYPKGLFFGGTEESWSSRTLKVIFSRFVSHATHVIVVDVHTGLGPHGHGEVILNVEPRDPAYERACKIWGERVTTTQKDSVSTHLSSSLKLAIPKWMPGVEVTAVSLEFGTFSSRKVLGAMRNENWLHHYGGKGHPDALKIKSEMLHIFYPNTEAWNHQVWKQGKEIAQQALAYFE